MKFIGVDFGWSSGASGLCSLTWGDQVLEIIDLTTIITQLYPRCFTALRASLKFIRCK